MTRRVAIALTTRGNYAKMKSTMRAIEARSDLELALVVGGGILQSRFGDFRPAIEADGFRIAAEIDFLVDGGETLASMTASAAAATRTFGQALGYLRADVALIIADRYEALSLAFAATCMNVPIAHLEGGEVSGSIDERLRHAITKLAHVHFPATPGAADILRRMGEADERIFVVGTPSLDIIADLDYASVPELGVSDGRPLPDLDRDFIVVSQHPVVTEYADARTQIRETADALATIGLPAIWIRPNMDAGGDGVRRALDDVAERADMSVWFYSSLQIESYARLLRRTRCLVGNSSSGLREAEFLGVPVVNIGTRQEGRERGANVIDVPPASGAISAAIRRQLAHGPYRTAHIYGNGRAGQKIAEVLAQVPLELNKRLAYE